MRCSHKPQIITGEGNAIFHCEWDNLNKILTNVHGTNVVNSAGGIMTQETNPGCATTKVRTLPLYDRSKDRGLKDDIPETLPEVYIYTRVGPLHPQQQVYNDSMQEYYVWFICRMVGSDGNQPVKTGQ